MNEKKIDYSKIPIKKKRLHTFEEAIEHIYEGGATHRVGSFYPYYRLDKFWGGICQIYFAGSAGEMRKSQGVSFTIEEQKSIDWILISKEELEELDRKKTEAYEKRIAEWKEDAKQRKLAEEKESKTLKDRFWSLWNKRTHEI